MSSAGLLSRGEFDDGRKITSSLRQHDWFSETLDEPVGVFVEGFEAEVVDQGF